MTIYPMFSLAMKTLRGIASLSFLYIMPCLQDSMSSLPVLSLEAYGRLVSIFGSLIVIGSLYHFLTREVSRVAGVFTALAYAVLPFSVFFSRTVLPENSALGLTFLAILCLYEWTRRVEYKKWQRILLLTVSCISFSAGILIKPTVVFFGFALGFLFLRYYEFDLPQKLHVYAYFIIAAAPFLLWRLHIAQFPEGIPVNAWLFTNVHTFEGEKNIFFRPAFFRWIFFNRISHIILGGFGMVFLILGFLAKQKKHFIHSIMLSCFMYLFIFQGGNVQHEYYQILLLPAITAAFGIGVNFMVENQKKFMHVALLYPAIAICCILTVAFSFYEVKGYYRIPEDLIAIVRVVQPITKSTDRIVTDRLGDTTLLYLLDRKGSPHVYKSLAGLKASGYTHLYTGNNEKRQEIKESGEYEVLIENDQFIFIKL